MIGNLEKFMTAPQANIIITIIGSLDDQSALANNLQFQNEHPFWNRITIKCFFTIKELNLMMIQQQKQEKGIIDCKWIENMTEVFPSVILLAKRFNNDQSFTIQKNEWIGDISSIKDLSKESIIYFYIVMNTGQLLKDQEDKDSYEEFSKHSDRKNFFFINTYDTMKRSEIKKQMIAITNSSLDCYRNIKKDYKNKVKEATSNEVKLEYLIKLGILSCIKNKKPTEKHFREGYNILLKIWVTSDKMKHFEEKTIADWLFLKEFIFKRVKKNFEIDEYISRAQYHISFLSDNSDSEGNSDYTKIYDLFWRYEKYMHMAKTVENVMKSYIMGDKFPGYYYIKASYYLIRLLTFVSQIEDYSPDEIIINDIKYNFNAIQIERYYLEKPPIYYYNNTVLNSPDKALNFNLDLKYFMWINKINSFDLNKKIRNEIFPVITKIFDSMKKNGFNDFFFYYTFLNFSMTFPEKINEDVDRLYDKITKSVNMMKYPLVYYNIIDKINQILSQKKEHSLRDKMRIANNLISLGNNRELTVIEEEQLFNMIGDDEVINRYQIANTEIPLQVNPEHETINHLLHIEYNLIGTETTKMANEVVEYQYIITTHMKSKPLKLKSVTLFYGLEQRTKQFENFDHDLTPDTPIILSHVILLKATEKVLMLKKVNFELEDFSFALFYIIHSHKLKTIIINPNPKPPLIFDYTKEVVVGLNEYYHFQCNITKNEGLKEDIGSITIDFERSNIEQGKDKRINDRNNSSSSHKDSGKLAGNFIEFYIKDPNDELVTKTNRVSFQIDNYESFNKKLSFLIRFKELGTYGIGFKAIYYVINKDCIDDHVEIFYQGIILFDVITPLRNNYVMSSNYFMISEKKTSVFMIGSLIDVQILLDNFLNTKMIIKGISSDTDNDITCYTPLQKIIELPNEDIADSLMTIMPKSNYIIPFEIKANKIFQGSFGSFTIEWTTKELKKFNSNIINTNTFSFSKIEIREYNLNVSYNAITEIEKGESFNLTYYLHNKTNDCKVIICSIKIEGNHDFLFSFINFKKYFILPDETKEFTITLIPIMTGIIKLPTLYINEFSSTSFTSSSNSIQYFPNNITVVHHAKT